MRRVIYTILFLFIFTNVSARHIKGGFFSYKYLGAGITNPSYLRYKITLTVFMECHPSDQQLNANINFTIFNPRTFQRLANPGVTITREYELEKTYDEPCISGDQRECYYTIAVYELNNYELPVSADGYMFAYQRCCRIEDMDNIINSGDVGNTYTITIPGTSSTVVDANKNNSPDFFINDTVVVCQNSFFSYPFKATDIDGDSLSYSLCSAYLGGGAPPNGQPEPNPAATPPYNMVPYKSPYNGSSPMGSKVTINSVTGMISGIAPPIVNTGEYVITVCVSEYRKGIYFAESRKELHIRVRNCDPIKAFLNPKPVTCDGFSVDFSNDIFTPSGTVYNWNFGDPNSGIANTSTSSKPTHTFTDTGIYTVKLKISLNGLCADSTTLKVKVYPGFFPGFRTTSPLCKGQPIQFRDTTKTNYGTVTGWRWDFADAAATNDTSHLKNPSYTYTTAGTIQNVQFIVANTFGCIDTVYKDIIISDNPSIQAMNDTLICSIDNLRLTATGNGNITWTSDNIFDGVNGQGSNPIVSPNFPTKYYATVMDASGCKNTDSVFVDVRTFITVDAGNDTTICKGDIISLHPISEALQYKWLPAADIDNAFIKNPSVSPLSTTTYRVIANLGLCQAEDIITIKVVPYPAQQVVKDTGICFSFSAKIYAAGGSNYSWSPATFLSDANIASPDVLFPTATTTYIATVTDTLGCPKPTYDTFTVRVIPKIIADAGPRDTAIVIGETLNLHGSGAEIYSWSPATGLSDPGSQNPSANLDNNMEYVLLAQTKEGCKGSDTISIKVYRVDPDLYVPTAFTPNGDGMNDEFKPILLGVKHLDYFNVFNRWGQLIYSSVSTKKGWDGTFGGKPQDPGTYVWQAKGLSFENKILSKKGYVILIR
ncbi:gliding motility-associated C-terminal domain-containing protein [Ferruginibacter lapsinanis]|uniref:PKD domain-containing protein n=1 Tax=Ferruginibacter lapsinanis TaxID=563172 RepID=UPI001E370334|nr:PKD domain-containing protein [Ferruginibacter lapsinanis]UEG48494.1 gliding motility-associated C-terminal domain-containing protein [Ferruginibacter lapsinanis]